VPKKTPPKQGQFEIKYASRAEVEAAVEEMPDEYLECRKRHAWAPYSAHIEPDAYEETERCLNCGVKREQITSRRNGALLSTKYYDRPDGYLFKGIGRISGGARDEVRRARVERRVIRHKKQEIPDQMEVTFSG
jgi:hypothetical protein